MAPVYRIAVIQMWPKPMDIDRNFQTAVDFIRAAALQKAQLAVLPEYHLLGWCPQDENFKQACSDWKTYLEKYCAIAKECNICIVPGTIIELHDAGTESERLLNVAYFISSSGEISGSYVKKNLWGSIERLHLTSSADDLHPVFDTPLGKIGMLICWDLAFPEAFREMIAHGAKLIIIPTFWLNSDCSQAGLDVNPAAETLFLDSILTARCFENTCAIVFANAAGPPGQGFIGLSQVCAPFAGPLTRLGSCAEGMAVVDLDMKLVDDAEDNYQVRADLAKRDWHYQYRHSMNSE